MRINIIQLFINASWSLILSVVQLQIQPRVNISLYPPASPEVNQFPFQLLPHMNSERSFQAGLAQSQSQGLHLN
jgi:hypothetical protein